MVKSRLSCTEVINNNALVTEAVSALQ